MGGGIRRDTNGVTLDDLEEEVRKKSKNGERKRDDDG